MKPIEEREWYTLDETAAKLGLSKQSAQNQVANETFPVPTYKLGRRRVVDKAVLAEFFRLKREAGLSQLQQSTSR